MKKMMMFLMVSVFFLMGGMTESMAQKEIEYRTVTLSVGQTFHVSFLGIYNGNQYVRLAFQRSGSAPKYSDLGYVSAYGKINIDASDEGEYWFGSYVSDGKGGKTFVYRLCVTLIIRVPGMMTSMSYINGVMTIDKDNSYKPSFICVQEKSVKWVPKMIVLA